MSYQSKAENNSRNVCFHLEPESITIGSLTSEELLKLSVQKIHSPFTFDALQHPLSGGLYDPALGPVSGLYGVCKTCLQNIHNCPGHMGHIELPVPVINIIYFKVLGLILKMSCVSCHKIQIQDHVKSSFQIIINLVEKGFVTEAHELVAQMHLIEEETLQIKTEESENVFSVPTDGILDKFNNLLNVNTEKIENYNTQGMKIQLIDNMIKNCIKAKKICMHCKKRMARIQAFHRRIIMTDPSEETASKVKYKYTEPKVIMADKLKKLVRLIWLNECEFLKTLFNIFTTVNIEYPVDILFYDYIPVTPPICRPINYLDGMMVEYPTTSLYKSIIQNCIHIRTVIKIGKDDQEDITDESKLLYKELQGESAVEKLYFIWQELQTDINSLISSSMKKGKNIPPGLKEIIEKKKGVIRQHMMGKRVNYAARSVITPDPNLNIDEVGIPEEFAKRLTYPVPVTSWNVQKLQEYIQNGPDVYPGAVLLENEEGALHRIPSTQIAREGLAKRLLVPDEHQNFKKNFGIKFVHRHVLNGDPVLVNRQPSLHKPSMMTHKVRVLKGEKTLRLHYANCKAYNADFDGDEMCIHYPQNELARSESYTIANVSNQYCVPKDGSPLSGLIQDHMIAGVYITLRGQFYSKGDYQELVYYALAHKTGQIKLLPPSIVKPVYLWSGKQIISTIIINCTPSGKSYINLKGKAKLGEKCWQRETSRPWLGGGTYHTEEHRMCESEVIIRNAELLCGVLDKTHYGATPYGLIHSMNELYGGQCACDILSSFSKLFTIYLQWVGFTLGVEDILVVSKADKERSKLIKRSRKTGKEVVAEAIDVPSDTPVEEMMSLIESSYVKNPKFRTILDRAYKSILDPYTNKINKTCIPSGLVSQFPDNNLQLMVLSGAKGSMVNCMQISCLLGQIELEGKRPPAMLSGRTLPSFMPYDITPRAGGFIDGRFMTGIQPQEFFFHCMAGREGLIDTAVKTSRSGYLQRCLIKHLEGLNIAYDMTVRDSDNSVIQFLYGEDGMDIPKVQFLNKERMDFFVDNLNVYLDEDVITRTENVEEHALKKYKKSVKRWKKKYGSHRSVLKYSECIDKDGYLLKENKVCPDPTINMYKPCAYLGSLTERLDVMMDEYLESKKGQINKKNYIKAMEIKAMSSLCSPGEPVGLLAAQSIGEPSTQMTLNTFHFAGRGEMNVTLGIPRLREILMTASKHIKTPSMVVPFKDNIENLDKVSNSLRRKLTRVTLDQVLEKINVKILHELHPIRQQCYVLQFHFLPYEQYKKEFYLKPKIILKYMEQRFFNNMFQALKKAATVKSVLIEIEEEKKTKSRNEEEDVEGDKRKSNGDFNLNMSEDESEEEDEDAAKRQEQDEDFLEPESEDGASESESETEENKNETSVKNTEETVTKEEEEIVSTKLLSSLKFAKNYIYDVKHKRWCQLTFTLPFSFEQIDITAVLRKTAEKSLLWETPQIKRAITYLNEEKRLMIRTDGINLVEMFKYSDILDLNKLYSNDIYGMLEAYGIEAAVKVLVKEMQEVFKVYGITVDPRHLILIADYMMFDGSFRPLSRRGMDSNPSPLQQMSFESALEYLKKALWRGKTDTLKSPSSCLMLGKPFRGGTGSFTLLQSAKVKLV